MFYDPIVDVLRINYHVLVLWKSIKYHVKILDGT